MRAARDNALGPQHLALAARACGAILLHVSTDYVFDGDEGRAVRRDGRARARSRSTAGRSSRGRAVRALMPEHFVVRVGYVFGGGDDYVQRRPSAAPRRDPPAGSRDRIGTPTYVRDLAARLLPLLLTGRFGTYHLAGPRAGARGSRCSSAPARIGDLPGTVGPQDGRFVGLGARPAPRTPLGERVLPHLGIAPFPPLDDAVTDWLASAASG